MRNTRQRIVFLILALLALVLHVPQVLELFAAFFDGRLSPDLIDRDFVNYWTGARLALEGQQLDLFREMTYRDHLAELFGPQEQDRSWSYPPHFLFLVLPLGLMPYETALAAFLITTFALYAGGTFSLRKADAAGADLLPVGAALVAFAVVNGHAVQNGFLTAALLLFGLAWRGQRPVLAGLAFGLLTVKPQLGLLVPLLLLFERDWRTFIWSGLFAAALAALSVASFGADVWRIYIFETWAEQSAVMTDWTGVFLYMMPTVFGAARSLGLDPETAFALQWPVSLAAALGTLWLFARDPSRLGRGVALLLATFLISPYGFDYDMGALAAGAALMVASGLAGRSEAALIAVAFLPAFVLVTGLLGVPVAPAVLMLALLARLLEVETERRRKTT